jgi:hypothetical protein
MSDTDEIRAALSDALRLPGEVHARPGAATTIRARARSRRRKSVVSFAVAVPACVVVALLVTNGSSPSSTSVPPAKVTPTPHASSPSALAPEIVIAPGPRTLATPIEIRPVLRMYAICPANSHTVAATDGAGCYRLGPAAIVMHRVRDMSAGIPQGGNDGIQLGLTMTTHDAAVFSTLTAASLHSQIALVVDGVVRTAPTVEGRITDGIIEISVPAAAAQALVTELTG